MCVPVLLSVNCFTGDFFFFLAWPGPGQDGHLEIQQAGMLSHGLCYGLLEFSGFIAWAWALAP